MRQGLTLLLLIFSFISFSQTVPQKINYQGVVRSSLGIPVANKTIGIKFRILQGTPTGAASSTETQNVTTNALGLFSTQIGSGAGSSLSLINWASGPYFLEVSIDTTGASSYILLGAQELVSVPYALAAGSAPSPGLNYGNDVLTVGNNTVNIPLSSNSASTSLLTSGALTSTLNGNVYQLNTPSVTLTGGTTILGNPVPAGIAQVFGTFPNYSISVAPVISYSNSTGLLYLNSIQGISPAYSYTANITPSLALNGSTLSLGPGSNSVDISTATPVTTLNIGAGGIGAITNPSTNNFSITIPPTNISGTGVTGAFPNYTITSGSSAQTSITASGSGNPVVSTIGTNSFNIAVPAVSLTTSGAITAGGTYPNLTLNSPSVTVVDNPAVGFAHVTGSFPNYMVTVAPSFNYNPLTGSLVVANTFSPALAYSFNVTPQLSYISGTLSSGPGTNTVFIPQASPPVISGSGAAAVSTSVNNFTVSVPVTSITASGGANVVGTYPSFTVSAPQQLNLGVSGGAGVSGAYPNITVSAPQQLNLTGTGGAAVTGTYPNINVNAPQQFNLTTSGGAGQSGTYPNITVSAPQQLALTTTGATTLGGTYPNLNVGTPVVTLTGGTTVFGTPVPSGIAQVSGAYPNYSIIVTPNISYSQVTGSLTLSNFIGTTPPYSYGYQITPNLAISNNVIQSGPAFNTVAIVSPAAQALTGINATGIVVASIGSQLVGSLGFTKQSATTEIDLYLHCLASSGVFAGASNITFELRIDGNAAVISSDHTITSSGQTDYVTLRAVFSGLATGNHSVSVWARTNAGLSTLVSLDPNATGKIILKETY